MNKAEEAARNVAWEKEIYCSGCEVCQFEGDSSCAPDGAFKPYFYMCRPLPKIGKTYKPHGKLIAIHSREGERFYFFEKFGGISLVPADLFHYESTIAEHSAASTSDE